MKVFTALTLATLVVSTVLVVSLLQAWIIFH